jgi:hypothetical protein
LAFKKFELGSSIWIYMDNKNLRLFPRDLVIKNKKKKPIKIQEFQTFSATKHRRDKKSYFPSYPFLIKIK